MKRIAALLLTLAILFSVAGCSKKPLPSSNPSITIHTNTPAHIGTWYVSLDDGDFYLTLKEDLTAIFKEIEGDSVDTYDYSYILVDSENALREDDSENYLYCYYDPAFDSLTVCIDGWNTLFYRSK